MKRRVTLSDALDVGHENVLPVAGAGVEKHPSVIEAEDGVAVTELRIPWFPAAQTPDRCDAVCVSDQGHVVAAIAVLGAEIAGVAHYHGVRSVGLNVPWPRARQQVLPDPGAIRTKGEVGVDVPCQKLVLRLARPVLEAAGALAVAVLDFLQEDDVGAERGEALTHLVHGQAPVELRQALVDVVARDVDGCFHKLHYKCVGSWRIAAALLGEKQRTAAASHGSQT